MNSNVYAVIIAGGSGDRLWPVSTSERPKQFVDIFGGKTLIRHAVDRLMGLIPVDRILVITSSKLIRLTRKTIPMVPAYNIIAEPCRRDTAAAVATAVGAVLRLGGDNAIGCVLTADHLISPEAKFRETLADAVKAAETSEAIVTIGIFPTFPATGYGYIECGKKADTGTRIEFNHVVKFVEKPDEATAKKYLKSGKFRWNSGMFIWKASVMKKEFEKAAPDIAPLIGIVRSAKSMALAVNRMYPKLRSISVDFAVMEKTKNILVAKSSFEWDDVGSWQAIPNHFPSDKNGNTMLGRAALMDTEGSIVVSSSRRHITAVLGMKDVVVVHTPEATLVCPKSKIQDVKKLAMALSRAISKE